MTLSTPVSFHIFNRPEYTEKVFQAIAKAKPQKLLVIADGPRDNVAEDVENCQKTRAIIERVDWDCEVLTNFSEKNLGGKLRNSSGLDWVFSQVEEAIILEDDCLPHPDFFKFCELLLEKYRHDERVMMIAGSNFLLDRFQTEESYIFSRFCVMWGWASWRRAWKKYDIEMKDWKAYKSQGQHLSLFAEEPLQKYITSAFDLVSEKEVKRWDVWDIPWFYSCLFNNGLSIIPTRNLISNIGIVGTHSNQKHGWHHTPVFPLDTDKIKHPKMVFQNKLFEKQFSDEFSPKKTKTKPKSTLSKIKSKLRRLNSILLKQTV